MKRNIFCISLLVLLIIITCIDAQAVNDDSLTVHFIDVGQGDSILVQCNGQNLLIDGGDYEASDIVCDYLRETVQIDKIDYIISTHPHNDHIFGLAAVISEFHTGDIYSTGSQYPDLGYQAFSRVMHQKKKTVIIPKYNDQIQLGAATLTFLSEASDDLIENNESLVCRLEYDNHSFLFMGDAEALAEERLLAKNLDLKTTVLKIGHHGANTSTTQPLLDATKPQYAIISVGKENKYGHPADDTLLKLLKMPFTNTYRTDMNGTIVIVSDGTNITMNTSKKSEKW